MPIVSFVVYQNRLKKSHVEIDAETVNLKAVAFVAEFSVVSKSHHVQMQMTQSPRAATCLNREGGAATHWLA